MVDSVAVFPAGYRLTDSTDGSPLSGAVIRFYDAGTTTPKIVYADADLLIELGTSVTTDSLGYPTSNGTTKTQIYVGTASYKIRIETSTGAEIVTHDNVKGAVVSDDGSSSAAVTALFPVVTKSLDYTVLAADQNKLIAVNCSSGDVILTLPSAVTVGNGWGILVQHAGSANQAILATVSSQTISEGSKSFGTTFALALNGEECWLISDGGNWRVTTRTMAFPKIMPIPVIDRVTAAPGAPVEGGFYLVTSAYSTFSTHDIIQYTDNGYVAFTPYTDCGWIAYVQDEDRYYSFQGSAWVIGLDPTASSTVAGLTKVSTQTIMETGTATDTAVLVGHQHYHPGHPKFWLVATVSANVPTLQTSYNMTSITDTATGRLTGTIATDFSSANWSALPGIQMGSNGNARMTYIANATQTAGAFEQVARDGGGSFEDPAAWYCTGLGDQ